MSDSCAELEEIFKLRWKADELARGRWQAANPGSDLDWPDHADLWDWLLEQLQAEKERALNAESTRHLTPDEQALLNRASRRSGAIVPAPEVGELRAALQRAIAAISGHVEIESMGVNPDGMPNKSLLLRDLEAIYAKGERDGMEGADDE